MKGQINYYRTENPEAFHVAYILISQMQRQKPRDVKLALTASQWQNMDFISGPLVLQAC